MKGQRKRGVTDTIELVEAATRLRKSYNATLRLVVIGVLDGARVGGRWLVRAADVERLLREQSVKTKWTSE